MGSKDGGERLPNQRTGSSNCGSSEVNRGASKGAVERDGEQQHSLVHCGVPREGTAGCEG